MRSFLRAVIMALAAMISSLLWGLPSFAAVTVDSVELLERTRVGRTTFNYTYRITATNNAPVALENVVAYLSQNPGDPTPATGLPMIEMVDVTGVREPYAGSGTQLLDDEVALGNLAAGETIVSTDTFMIQQDRRFALDTDSLIWEVGFTSVVTLSGVITDRPISFADVEIIVDRGESGRPIIESGRPIVERYTTTADEDGNYSVDVDFVADPDFVTINGVGVNDLDFVDLTSIAGSAGSLLERATDSPPPPGPEPARPQVSSADANELNATHVSTALAALATAANGGVGFTNDAGLAAAQAQVDSGELLIAAAVLKTVIDNAGIELPPGVATTSDLLVNPDVFAAFLANLQSNFPDELQSAIDETIIDLSSGYVAAELPERLYLTLVSEDPFDNGANVFAFDQNGSATHIDSDGETTDADWIVNAAGDIVVSLNNSPVTEFFPLREVPPGSGNSIQVRALVSTTELRIARIAVGVQTDQVLLGFTTLTTFPDHVGVLPDEIVVTPPGPDGGRLAFEATAIRPFASAELADRTLAMRYFHTDNNAVGVQDPNFGVDLLTFAANGTGTTARRLFAFTWSIDSDGRLVVVFSNGDRNEYVRYGQRNQGVVGLGVLVARYGAGLARALDSIDIRAATGAGGTFDQATLVNHKFRHAGSIVGPDGFIVPGLPRFDFNFLTADTGCRDIGALRFFDWDINSANYMQLEWTAGSFLRQRAWQRLATLPGTLGTRYWVIENLDSVFDPLLLTDPTVTPGRINFYEDIKDISGNTPPTAVADEASTTVDTPVFIDVLANDIDAEDDPILLWTAGATALGGTVVFETNAENTIFTGFTYTPPPGVSGVTDTFTYSVADGSCAIGPADAGTVSVTIGSASGTANYDEQIAPDISGTYGQGPVFQLGVGANTIAGVGNGPEADPAGAPFDFDVFSIVIPDGATLTSITLSDWGTQTPSGLYMRVRPGIQGPDPYEWSVVGGFDPFTQQQATAQSIAADVAAIPLTQSEYTFNNSGSLFDPGIPYRWTFVVTDPDRNEPDKLPEAALSKAGDQILPDTRRRNSSR